MLVGAAVCRVSASLCFDESSAVARTSCELRGVPARTVEPAERVIDEAWAASPRSAVQGHTCACTPGHGRTTGGASWAAWRLHGVDERNGSTSTDPRQTTWTQETAPPGSTQATGGCCTRGRDQVASPELDEVQEPRRARYVPFGTRHPCRLRQSDFLVAPGHLASAMWVRLMALKCQRPQRAGAVRPSGDPSYLVGIPDKRTRELRTRGASAHR